MRTAQLLIFLTVATVALALQQGAKFQRGHDAKQAHLGQLPDKSVTGHGACLTTPCTYDICPPGWIMCAFRMCPHSGHLMDCCVDGADCDWYTHL
ncbi:MAG: hypothetical protein JOS17DRAFT_738269 [Linnemannia elongata]|nr:MAG: hypothetical protein JOS17DRAFT_738269 [Linnemannia elongata]